MNENFKKADSLKIIMQVSQYLETLADDKEYTITIKEHRKKRSLSANALCWKLIGKLAEKTRIPTTEIYRHYIKEIGGNFETICIQRKAVESFKTMWEAGHIGRFCEEMASKVPGCVNLIVYTGSSDYDTATMSRLIDMIIQDCNEQGIETYNPAELEKILIAWGA